MNTLYQAHSGLRYLVLLAGLAAVVALAYGAATGRPPRAARGITSAFTGLLDLQILIGICLVIAGVWYGALVGHLAMMVLGAVAAHAASVMARKRDERGANTARLVGVVLALVLIGGGITAIGRGPFTSQPMTAPSR